MEEASKKMMTRESHQKGFSFIELSIGMALAGLFVATCLQVYRIYQHQHIRNALGVITPQGTVDVALERFIIENSRYPCPADPTLPEDNVNAGVEVCASYANMTALNAAVPIGASLNGQQGFWRVAGTHSTGQGADKDSVMIGSIPYTTLGISAPETYDGWSNKFGYAITEALTIALPPGVALPDKGTITLADPAGKSITGKDANLPANQHALLVWSYGSSRAGAWTSGGRRPAPCDTTTPTRDSENCDNDAVFLSDTKPSTIRSLVRGVNFYDTYIGLFEVNKCNSDWCLTPQSRNSGAPSLQSTYIGIGIKNPQAPLHVAGDIRATRAIVDKFCDATSANCFTSDLIGGKIADGRGLGGSGTRGCHGEAISGIAKNAAVCPLHLPPGALLAFTCPTGRIAFGTDATGKLKCQTPP